MRPKAICLFFKDLRLSDHMPMHTAHRMGYDIVPVFILSEKEEKPWQLGAASAWWLHHSLKDLSNSFKQKGSRLILRQGDYLVCIKKLIEETKAQIVLWHTRVDPSFREFEQKLESQLKQMGVKTQKFFDSLLFTPGDVLNGKQEPYQVFTPFYKACLKMPPPRAPIAEPTSLPSVSTHIHSLEVDELGLLPEIPWDKEFYSLWHPGEKHAKERLKNFLASAVGDYKEKRDYPSIDATSRLSPHLHFGEISPFQIWHAAAKGAERTEAYTRQLIWREFAHHMLYFFSDTDLHPLRKEFSHFPWKKDTHLLHLWQKGMTGYPIVDAGMRQLWRLGWMHNRLRMIVGSFLVKDLFLPWQEGAKWFWDTLVDADLSNNSFGWQWVAGCGADAAPYFRIFNPITQAERFDPEGIYVRAFVPELKDLPNEWIHRPWMAPPEVLRAAGVTLGKTYPQPIVCHDTARKLALEYFHDFSKTRHQE